MPTINSTEEVILTAGGGTKNLLTTSGVSLYIITGTATLTSNWTIQPSGIPVIGMTYSFLYKANIDLGISTITIFGETLPTNLADKEFRAESVWNGTTWVTSFLPDISESGVIPANSVYTNQQYFVDAFINQYSTPAAIDFLSMINGLGTGGWSLVNSNLKTLLNEFSRTIDIVGYFTMTGVDENSIDEDTKYKIAESSYIVGNGSYQMVGHVNNNEVVTPIKIFINELNDGDINIRFEEGAITTNTGVTLIFSINLKIPY